VTHTPQIESSRSIAGLGETRRNRTDWNAFDGENEADSGVLTLQDRCEYDPQAHGRSFAAKQGVQDAVLTYSCRFQESMCGDRESPTKYCML
jgi:hypothetical protein